MYGTIKLHDVYVVQSLKWIEINTLLNMWICSKKTTCCTLTEPIFLDSLCYYVLNKHHVEIKIIDYKQFYHIFDKNVNI